ncbi:hypothetical protein EVAR_57607_1 [Eumeta japonica]|uniref:Uncharacterized protein n=1 Tax=Eumeta variegata TaxID=151549 RepID=A0A4C1XWE5_EUMVA|nr:hypothetical protein EVAR_57607_1 [Eumeta japonica]
MGSCDSCGPCLGEYLRSVPQRIRQAAGVGSCDSYGSCLGEYVKLPVWDHAIATVHASENTLSCRCGICDSYGPCLGEYVKLPVWDHAIATVHASENTLSCRSPSNIQLSNFKYNANPHLLDQARRIQGLMMKSEGGHSISSRMRYNPVVFGLVGFVLTRTMSLLRVQGLMIKSGGDDIISSTQIGTRGNEAVRRTRSGEPA